MIFPERRQRVQTFTWRRVPSITTWTRWRFTRHTRRVLLLAWDTLFPTPRRLLQMSQTLATLLPLPVFGAAAPSKRSDLGISPEKRLQPRRSVVRKGARPGRDVDCQSRRRLVSGAA